MKRAIAILGLFLACTAQAEWVLGESDDREAMWVLTVNDEMQALGQWCMAGSGSCMWTMMSSTGCEDHESYPALVNGAGRAVAVTLVCAGSFEVQGMRQYRYAFAPFDAIDEVVRGDGTVAIVYPIESSRFKALVFDVTGAAATLDAMRSRVMKRNTSSARSKAI